MLPGRRKLGDGRFQKHGLPSDTVKSYRFHAFTRYYLWRHGFFPAYLPKTRYCFAAAPSSMPYQPPIPLRSLRHGYSCGCSASGGDAPSGRPRRGVLHRQTLTCPCAGSATAEAKARPHQRRHARPVAHHPVGVLCNEVDGNQHAYSAPLLARGVC